MEKPNSSSFEAEFNRLSFLASIATGTTIDDNSAMLHNSMPIDSLSLMKTSNILQDGLHHNSNVNGNAESHSGLNTTDSNGINDDICPAVNTNADLQKIQNLLLNASPEEDMLHTNEPSVNIQQKENTPSNFARHYITTSTDSSLQFKSSICHNPSTPTRTVVTQTMSSSNSTLTIPAGVLGNKNTSLLQQQQLKKIASMNKPQYPSTATLTATSHAKIAIPSVNHPLVISSIKPTKGQQPVVANNGQTFLLPANFAGLILHFLKKYFNSNVIHR